jgi:hypothetical protein
MYTRVKKDQFEIRDGVYIHRPTEAEFAPNPNSEGSMLIYTGNINSKLASGELFAYYEILQVMKVLWEESAGIRPESQKPYTHCGTRRMSVMAELTKGRPERKMPKLPSSELERSPVPFCS